MAHERLVRLLRTHRQRIARAMVRQTRSIAPRYQQLDATAHEKSYVSLMMAAEKLLEAGSANALLDFAEHTAQLRVATGFTLEDFTLGVLSVMPVLRRFIFEHSPTPEDAIDDYDALERVAIPMLARATMCFRSGEEEITAPTRRPDAMLRDYDVVSLLGDEGPFE